MTKIKSLILSALEFLPDKINTKELKQQFVTLNAVYNCQCGTIYTLTIEVLVQVHIADNKVQVNNFKIHATHFFLNNGEKPSFAFSKEELTDYIDF